VATIVSRNRFAVIAPGQALGARLSRTGRAPDGAGSEGGAPGAEIMPPSASTGILLLRDSMREARTVLVTGASTGLGLALARRLLEVTPCRLVLTARESSMKRFAPAGIVEGPRVHLRALDVTSAEQRKRVVEEAADCWGGVDVLVNNAGVMYRSVLEHVSDAERLEQMDVNYQAPMALIRLVLPHMRAQRAGRILNVSSVGGMMAMPTMAIYSASKFALEGATEALYYEVKPWNI
jgi:short-subunit dehydrogenase